MVNILLNDNFDTFTIGSGTNDWHYFNMEGILADKGFVQSGPNGTTIGVVPATLDDTTNSGFEHVK